MDPRASIGARAVSVGVARTRSRSSRVNGWAWCLLPLMVLLGVVFVVPLAWIAIRSFTDFSSPGDGGWDNYRWFFGTDINLTILRRTMLVALWITVVCAVLAYPYAYMMTLVGRRARALMFGAVLLPFFMSYIVRNFAWIVLLQDDGPVSDAFGLIGLDVTLLGTTAAVTIGMAQILLPMMVLPLYATMQRIDRTLLAAAQGLGARPMKAFFKVYFPLSLPGVFAGSVIIFVFALGFYVTPLMLGSPQNTMFSSLILTQVQKLLEWGRAGAMGLILLALSLLILAIGARLSKRSLTAVATGRDS